jgi:hypothetical protein
VFDRIIYRKANAVLSFTFRSKLISAYAGMTGWSKRSLRSETNKRKKASIPFGLLKTNLITHRRRDKAPVCLQTQDAKKFGNPFLKRLDCITRSRRLLLIPHEVAESATALRHIREAPACLLS